MRHDYFTSNSLFWLVFELQFLKENKFFAFLTQKSFRSLFRKVKVLRLIVCSDNVNMLNQIMGVLVMVVEKDMIIGDVLNMDRGTVPIFMQHGLHCLGCAMASGETIEEACIVHGLDCDMLIDELNEYFSEKEKNS